MLFAIEKGKEKPASKKRTQKQFDAANPRRDENYDMLLSQMPPYKQFKESFGNKAVMKPVKQLGGPPQLGESASPNLRTKGGKKLTDLLPENSRAFSMQATTE